MRGGKAKKSRLGFWTLIALALLISGYVAVLDLARPHVRGETLTFSRFSELATNGRISDATFLDQDSYVLGSYLNEENIYVDYNTPLLEGMQGRVLEVLLDANIPISIDQQVGKRVAQLATLLLPGLIIVVLFGYLVLSYRSGSGLFSIGSGARKIRPEDVTVKFDDVAGQDAAVTELREISEFLSNPSRYADLGAVVPKGILLFGPPGCGKTMLARALAGEVGAAFYSISGSDFVELYVGVGASRVRELFTEAQENAPALIFIDELDSVGRARSAGGVGGTQGEQEQALNQILAEMDGVSPSQGVMVVAATNRPDVLDPALLRPGRFDRSIGLERPDEKGRLAILEVHAKGKAMEGDIDLAAIARHAIGMTGADLASVVNEAALLAARANRTAISQVELDQALHRILDAPERQRRLSMRARSIGKRFSSDQRLTFSDVAGVDDAVAELTEVKDYLADPDRFSRMGARMPRGILLAGPPGCGKTLLARAVAGEANAAFISVAGSEFVEVFVGQGASRVRELFAEARSVEPAIVFIDEIDAIGGRRGGADGLREMEQTLNQFLVELDGFEARTGVIVMAATNRIDILDPALVRPGRFDRQITVSLPDRAGRRAILGLHAKDKPLRADVDLDALARLTQGLSGADLANVMNEAALLAARRSSSEITMALMEEGVERATMGVSSRAMILSDAERSVVAHHEAGHALVSFAFIGGARPHKVTIVPQGGSLGHCRMVDDHDATLVSRSALMDHMASLVGGWAAEKLVFGEPSSAASNDLARVGTVARQMVHELGMGEQVGLLAQSQDPTKRAPYSETATEALETEVRRLMDQAHQRAHDLLMARRETLDRIAQALLERETLTATDLEDLMASEPTLASAGDPS